MKSLKKVWNEQKRLETAEKIVQPAFGCVQHPKSGPNTQHTMAHLYGFIGYTIGIEYKDTSLNVSNT